MSKALTAALQHRERLANRMAMIANRTDSALVVTDCCGCVEWVNDGFTRMTGCLASEIMGRKLLRTLDFSANSATTLGELRRHLRAGDAFKIELRNQTASGKRYLAAVEVQPLMDEAGRAAGYSVVAIDVTHRARVEEELREAHDKLEARVQERTAELAHANEALQVEVAERTRAEVEAHHAHETAIAATNAKSEFLANMSHEIRTPMTAVMGYTELLLDPEQSPSERLNHVNIIRRNAEHLLTVINDILDISKIEAGKMKVERIACEPRRIIADVTSFMRVRAAEKNLSFTVEYAGPIPQTIESDPTRLRQILINLVSNAIKFTESGGVRIVVQLLQGPNPPRLRFEILDSGIGMSAEHLERMFQAFEQADGSTTRRFGGTGLGLTISRRLALLLGGDITAESELGKGSRFVCTVETGPLDGVLLLDDPHEVAATESRATQRQWRLSGHVLLAEDGLDNQQLLSAYLRRAGCDVSIASNGRIACEAALAAADAGHPFDVILMDMQMPELDGYGAASMLRTKGYAGGIIALTAHAMAEDRDKCLQSGCTDYLTKPVSRHDLLEIVAKFVHSPCNLEEPLRSTSDDDDLRKFLPQFVERLPGHVAALGDLLRREQLDELALAVHQLKGTGGLFGFQIITESAGRAEHAVRRSDPLEAVTRSVEELIAVIRRVEGYDAAKEMVAVEQS